MWAIRAALLVVATSVAQATLQIVPGATWTTFDSGELVQAHGGSIFKVADTYGWIGEDKTDGSPFKSINCYQSHDLIKWSFVQTVFRRREDGGDLGANRIVERPKIIYNKKHNKWVIWMHIDNMDYTEARIGVAHSYEACGLYSYLGSFRPMGHESRDIGLYQEEDGTAYLLSNDKPNNSLRIYALTEDYTNITSNPFTFPTNIEAPAMIKKDGNFFVFGSHLTGWHANDNVYSHATSIVGPWADWKTFATPGTNTYESQTTLILPIGDLAVYVGDRWVPSNLRQSTYVWLPLNFTGTTVSMPNLVSWVLDAGAGTWAPAPAETTREAETNSLLSGSARIVDCTGCGGGKAVGQLGGDGNGTLQINGISSEATTNSTIRIYYTNPDPTPRYAVVNVSGNALQTIAFLPSLDSNTPAVSVLHTSLKQGSDNHIEIRALINTPSSGDLHASRQVLPVPDIDALKVPVR